MRDYIVEVNYAGCSSEKVTIHGFGLSLDDVKRTAFAIFAAWGAEYHESEAGDFFKDDDAAVWYWYEDSRQYSIEGVKQ